jgi:hypothetical protein
MVVGRVSGSSWGDASRWATGRWIRLMSGATRIWIRPGLAGAVELAATNERLATAVLDGVLDQMRGQAIDWRIGDRTLRARIKTIRLRRQDTQLHATLDLDHVVWDEWPLGEVRVTAASLRLDPASAGRLKAAGIEVVYQARLEPLLTWVGKRLGARSLDLDRDGRINLVRRRFGLRAVIGGVVVQEGRLAAELHGLGWRGIRLTLPARLRPTRFVSLPPLPLDVSIVEARRHGDVVDVRLTIPSLMWTPGPGGIPAGTRMQR